MKKRLLSIALVLCMLLSFLTSNIYAESATSVIVGGKEMYLNDLTKTYYKVDGTGNVSIISDGSEPEGGTAKYDPVTNTLFLRNFQYTGQGIGSSYDAVIYSNGELNIMFEGINTIINKRTTSTRTDNYVIYSERALNVSGEGELNIIADNSSAITLPDLSRGIFITFGDLSIEGMGAQTKFTSYAGKVEGKSCNSIGISLFNGNINISGSQCEIIAYGGEVGQDSYVENSEARSIGINASSINATGGSIKAYGGEAMADDSQSIGMQLNSYLRMNENAVAYAEGRDVEYGSKNSASYGMYIHGLIITNATVEAYGGDIISSAKDAKSYGIYMSDVFRINEINHGAESFITAKGGMVQSGENENAYSYGIYVKHSMKVYGKGTILADGGKTVATNIAYSAGLEVINSSSFIVPANEIMNSFIINGNGGDAIGASSTSTGIRIGNASNSSDISRNATLNISDNPNIEGVGGNASGEIANSYGLYIDTTTFNVSGGTITGKAGTSINTGEIEAISMALSKEPTLSNGRKITASYASSGEPLVFEYNSEELSNYKYIKIVTNTVTELDLTEVFDAPETGKTKINSISHTQYSANSITWSPTISGGIYLANTSYTAIFTLTAASGYTFEGLQEDQLTHDFGVVTNPRGDGTTLAVIITFSETGPGELSELIITKEPNKVVYKDGDTFDPEGMIVKAVYNDGTEDADYNDYTIEISSEDGKLRSGITKVIIKTMVGENEVIAEQAVTVKEIGSAPSDINGSYTASTIYPDKFIYTIETISGAVYKMDDGVWQDSNVFDNIEPLSNHIFYTKYVETETHTESPDINTGVVFFDKIDNPATIESVTGHHEVSETNLEKFVYIIDEISGTEYSMDNVNWQTDNEVDGLEPGQSYTFYARYKTTPIYKASVSTSSGVITLNKLPREKDGNLILNYDVTGSSINRTVTITYVEGAEYSFDGVNYSDVRVKDVDITEPLTVYIRYAQTATYQASEVVSTEVEFSKSSQEIGFNENSVSKVYGDSQFTNPAVLSVGNGSITYESDNEDVAIVDSTTGQVTISGVGGANITATAAETSVFLEAKASYSIIVTPKLIDIPVADGRVFTYNGEAQTYYIASSSYYSVNGNIKTNANEEGYTVSVYLYDAINTRWSDNSIDAKTYSFVIIKKPIEVPEADSTVFAYDGTNKTYGITETSSYNVTGNSKKDAGTYNVIVGLKDTSNTKWNDGSNGDKTYTFTINKANITIVAKNKNAYVGEAAPLLGDTDYTVTGLASGDTLKTKPTIEYVTTPDMTKTGTVAITVSGAQAPDGGNYNEIAYQDGELTITNRPSSEGGSTTPSPVVEVKSGQSTTSSNLNWLVATGKKLIVTGDEGAKLVFDTETLKGISEQTSDDIKIEIKEVSPEYKENLLDKLVFSLTVSTSTGTVSNFTGKVVVSLPYELKEGELPQDVTVWYLASDGTMTEIPCSYDPETKFATFLVTHFSLYVVGVSNSQSWINPFKDVTISDWFYSAVRFINQNGLFVGTSENNFSPTSPMTRAMLWTVLGRLNGQDFYGSDAFELARKWAMREEITDGANPSDNITREQIVTILWRYVGLPKVTGDLSEFKDSDSVSSYAVDAMIWAIENGIIMGADGTLMPKDNATRAQVAAIIERFMIVIEK